MRDATELGASLYLPATRLDLLEVVRGERLSEVRSVIFCTEDSVRLKDLPFAIENLRAPIRALTSASHQIIVSPMFSCMLRIMSSNRTLRHSL